MFGKGPPSVSSGKDTSPETAQRRFARADVDLAASYTTAGALGEREARIGDLSVGGVRLVSDEDVASGSPIELRFALAERPIRAQGRVVLSYFDAGAKRFNHGVAFTAIEPAAQEAIAALVASGQEPGAGSSAGDSNRSPMNP
jgi:c-di-GMP-binding flagellar brake protein YcgR